jgi:hypothetical protein
MFQKSALYQGATLQSAEKLGIESALYQGTTQMATENM